MKWFFLILSMAVKRFSHVGDANINPINEVKEFITENALKVLLLFTAASTTGTLFVAGVVMTVINLTAQYDAGFQPRVTAMAGGGIGIVLVSIIIFAIGIYYATVNRREDKKAAKEQQRHLGNSLEEVLILLVNDFIAEREAKRELKRAQRHAYRPKSEENENNYFKPNEEPQRH